VWKKNFLHSWHFTDNQFVFAASQLRLTTSDFVFKLNACGHSTYVPSSVTREWFCHLQFLLALASAVILRFESHWIFDILLSQIPDSPNLKGEVPILISRRHWIPISSPPMTRRNTVEVLEPASTRPNYTRLSRSSDIA
jgi:hypothetical protein